MVRQESEQISQQNHEHADTLAQLYNEIRVDKEWMHLAYIESIIRSLNSGKLEQARRIARGEWDKLQNPSLQKIKVHLVECLFDNKDPWD